LELLKDYDIEIHYHPGKANVVTDALSRKTQHSINTIIVTQPRVLEDLERLGIELVSHGSTRALLSVLEVQPSLLEEIKFHQKEDDKLQRIRQNLEKGKAPGFMIKEDGTLRFQSRLCMPNKADSKEKILTEAHNTQYSVHPGGKKMYRDLKQYFWWDNMKREIAEYVDRCLACQKVKAKHQWPTRELRPLQIPTWKWDSISMDFIMGLPPSASKRNAIWVIVDRLTKFAHFLPIHDTWGTKRLAQLYVKEIVCLHGIPKDIMSDRDRRFQVRFWQALQRAFGTKLNFSSSYHPETDGQTERVNQMLEDMLRACALDFQGKWEEYLPLKSSLIITVTNLPSKWNLLRHFMGENVEPPYVGMSWMKH